MAGFPHLSMACEHLAAACDAEGLGTAGICAACGAMAATEGRLDNVRDHMESARMALTGAQDECLRRDDGLRARRLSNLAHWAHRIWMHAYAVRKAA